MLYQRMEEWSGSRWRRREETAVIRSAARHRAGGVCLLTSQPASQLHGGLTPPSPPTWIPGRPIKDRRGWAEDARVRPRASRRWSCPHWAHWMGPTRLKTSDPWVYHVPWPALYYFPLTHLFDRPLNAFVCVFLHPQCIFALLLFPASRLNRPLVATIDGFSLIHTP